MNVTLNGEFQDLFIASSPLQFCATGRTNDIDALLHVIDSADKTICGEVMDFAAATLYTNPSQFWPVLSNALKEAAYTYVNQIFCFL